MAEVGLESRTPFSKTGIRLTRMNLVSLSVCLIFKFFFKLLISLVDSASRIKTFIKFNIQLYMKLDSFFGGA